MWSRSGVRLAFAATVVQFGALVAAPADARTNHALIVAVTAYPNLPPQLALVGPNNDAQLIRNYLSQSAPVPFKDGNVTVLADGIPSDGSPTLARIERELDAIAAKAASGDFVYLHFSGHGAQQPAADLKSEPDGLDEIFLPADASSWADRAKAIPGAFSDNRIDAALKKIRATGAFVWAVFDSCHSGTVTRAGTLPTGAGDEEVSRKAQASDLGIPEAAIDAAVAAAGGDATRGGFSRDPRFSADAGGGMVAFFAAQTVEETPELKLPRGDPEAVKYGLFTYTMFSRLASNPGVTYRQLAQDVLQAYAAQNRARPTPLFEGALDAPVFGAEPGDIVQQWKIEIAGGKASIPAGALHRLTPGSKLAILASPSDPDDAALGYLEIVAVRNLTSTLKPVAYADKPVLSLAKVPPNAFARVAEIAIDFRLKVARPAASDRFAAEIAAVNATLDALASKADFPASLDIVGPQDSADVVLGVFAETKIPGAGPDASPEARLWFLPSTGEATVDLLYVDESSEPDAVALSVREPGGHSRGLRIVSGTARDAADAKRFAGLVEANLTAIYRATNLARLTAASDFKADDVTTRLLRRNADTGAFEDIEPGAVPIVHPDDEVHLDAVNRSARPVDVNVLYIGSDYSIAWNGGERLHPGDRLELPLFAIVPSSFGIERLVVVLTEADAQRPVENLEFLSQAGLRSEFRGTRGDSVSSLLKTLGGGQSRGGIKLGAKKGEPPLRTGVSLYTMETRPRD